MNCTNCNTLLSNPLTCDVCGKHNPKKSSGQIVRPKNSSGQIVRNNIRTIGLGCFGLLLSLAFGSIALDIIVGLMNQVYILIFCVILSMISLVVLLVGVIREISDNRRADKEH